MGDIGQKQILKERIKLLMNFVNILELIQGNSMYTAFNKETASTKDRIAWILCQIIDDDAPMRWTRYRFVAECIAVNEDLMAELTKLSLECKTEQQV